MPSFLRDTWFGSCPPPSRFILCIAKNINCAFSGRAGTRQTEGRQPIGLWTKKEHFFPTTTRNTIWIFFFSTKMMVGELSLIPKIWHQHDWALTTHRTNIRSLSISFGQHAETGFGMSLEVLYKYPNSDERLYQVTFYTMIPFIVSIQGSTVTSESLCKENISTCP